MEKAMTNAELEVFLDKHVFALGEHFEHVQIMVSWDAEGQTNSLKRGTGNWYARQGMAHEFIQRDQALENAEAIRKVLPPPEPPDDADQWKQS